MDQIFEEGYESSFPSKKNPQFPKTGDLSWLAESLFEIIGGSKIRSDPIPTEQEIPTITCYIQQPIDKEMEKTNSCEGHGKCSSAEEKRSVTVSKILHATLHCRTCGSFSAEANVLPCGHMICSKHVAEDSSKLTFEEQMQRYLDRKGICPDMKPDQLLANGCGECKEKTWSYPTIVSTQEKEERTMLFRLAHLFFTTGGCFECVKPNEEASSFVCLTCMSILCGDHKTVHANTKVKGSNKKGGHECILRSEFKNKFDDIVSQALEQNCGPSTPGFFNYNPTQWKLELIQLCNKIIERNEETENLIRQRADCITKMNSQFAALQKLLDEKQEEIRNNIKSSYDQEIEKSKARASHLKQLKDRAKKVKNLSFGLKEFASIRGTCIDKIILAEHCKTMQQTSQAITSSEVPSTFSFEINFPEWFDRITSLQIQDQTSN